MVSFTNRQFLTKYLSPKNEFVVVAAVVVVINRHLERAGLLIGAVKCKECFLRSLERLFPALNRLGQLISAVNNLVTL